MATVTKIGPADRGRRMSAEEFLAGDYEEGYYYELIDGRLYVSAKPNLPAGRLEKWLVKKLDRYSDDNPEVIRYVSQGARVFIPGRPDTTPEPDVAAYRDFPSEETIDEDRWEDVSPVLVGEVISADDPDKDLVRNVELYLQVPTVKEYWILDPRPRASQPSMTVYRRHGKQWRKPLELAFGEVYTTKLLPGFELIVDPRQ